MKKKARSSRSTRYIYLVRHGQYEMHGRPHRLGPRLTKKGRLQAERTARRLARLPIDAIYYSSLRRAAETARILCKHMPRAKTWKSRALWEGLFTPVPGMKTTAASMRSARRHAQTAFRRIFQPARKRDQRIVVVCHGNITGYFVSRVLRAPLASWLSVFTQHNCGICTCGVRKKGRFALFAYNDTSHLPKRLRTLF